MKILRRGKKIFFKKIIKQRGQQQLCDTKCSEATSLLSLSKLFWLVFSFQGMAQRHLCLLESCLCQEPLVQNASGSLAAFWGTGIGSGDYREEKYIFFIPKPFSSPSTGSISFHFLHSLTYPEVGEKQK